MEINKEQIIKILKNRTYLLIIIIMLIVWGSLLWYMVIYGEDVRRNPCSICSEKIGKNVVCSFSDFNSIQTKTFYPDGTSLYEIK